MTVPGGSAKLPGVMNKFFRIALQNAREHDFDTLEFKLCSVITRGGSIISVGFNKRNTNGFVDYYSELAKGQRAFCESTHSEMDAVLQARDKTDLRGCKIHVLRLKENDTLGLAKPCEICEHVLYNYGIKKAFYTIDDTNYGIMKIINPAKKYQNV